MIVARAIEVTPARLIETNVTGNEYPEWAPGSYDLGARFVKDRHVWYSATAANAATPGQETVLPLKWVDEGPVNAWRMFDKRIGNDWQVGTFTENPESIDVVFQAADVVNAIGLVGVAAASVSVQVTVPGIGVVYDTLHEMADYGVDDYYDYFFAPIERRDSLALLDLPAYGNALIRVTAHAPDAVARIGSLVFGYQETLGVSVYGTSAGFESYSVQKLDPWGNLTVTPGGARDVVDFDVRIETERTAYVRRRIRELRDTPTLYVGAVGLDISVIIGITGNFRVVISNPAYSESAIEVRSLQ